MSGLRALVAGRRRGELLYLLEDAAAAAAAAGAGAAAALRRRALERAICVRRHSTSFGSADWRHSAVSSRVSVPAS